MKISNARFAWLAAGLLFAGGPASLPAQMASAPADNSGVVSADSGTISGMLVMPANNGAAPAIAVTVTPGDQTTTTDAAGSYTLPNLKPGRYSLFISGDGYARLRIDDVVVQPGQVTTVSPRSLSLLRSSNRVAGTAGQEITSLGEFVVNEQKMQPFVEHNADLARTVDDVQPYYIFDSQTINTSGAVNTEDFLRQRLPMNTQAQEQGNLNGPAYGDSSMISLRGLGSTQTLILIDGRRQPTANENGTAFQTDLNGIPLAMIDRIEVLPASASAIYGGGSVGGVVDVILKKDYQGGEINATYTNTMNSDSPVRSVNGIVGFTLEGGKTHVTISGSTSETLPIELQDRTFLEDNVHRILQNDAARIWTTAGNPFGGATPNITLDTTAYTNAYTGVAFANPNNTSLVLKNGASLGSLITYVPAGTAPGSANLAAGLLADAGTYNENLPEGVSVYGLEGTIAGPFSAKALSADIRREMSKDVEVYFDFENSGTAGYYNGTQFDNNAIIVPGNAPGNPFNDNVRIQIPNAQNNYVHTDLVNQSISTGAVVTLPFSWTAMLDYSWTAVRKDYWGAVGDDGPAATRPNSVDQDLGSGALSPFQDTIAYPINLNKYAIDSGADRVATLNDYSLRLSGPLDEFTKHLGLGTTTLTTGLEHRKEGIENGDLTYADLQTPQSAYYSVYFGQDETTNSVYSELDSILIDPKRNIPLLHSLSAQIAGRLEDYQVSTGTTSYSNYLFPATGGDAIIVPGYSNGAFYVRNLDRFSSVKPMFGLKDEITDDISIRASYSTAFVPPTFAQLLPNPIPSTAQTTITDPANGQTYGVLSINGGNPATKPQTSTNWDYGVIYEPRSGLLKGLRANLQYYDITESNVISTYPTIQYIVSNLPSRLNRNPATGLITSVDNTNTNLLGLETKGWDAQLDYIEDTGIGTFSFSVLGSMIEHLKKQVTVGQPFLEYVGYVASGGVPKTKGNVNVTWQYKHSRAGWSTSFIDSYKEYESPGDPSYLGVANATPVVLYTQSEGSNHVPSQIYHHVFYTYDFGTHNNTGGRFTNDILNGLKVTATVDNLFNSAPPMDSFYSPYYYSPFGSVLLRTYTLMVSKDF